MVVVVGAENLPDEPPLLNADGQRLRSPALRLARRGGRLLVQSRAGGGALGRPRDPRAGDPRRPAAAVMVIPRRPAATSSARRTTSRSRSTTTASTSPARSPIYRVQEVLDRWKTRIVDARLKQDKLPQGYTEPIRVKAEDVATGQEVGGSVWAGSSRSCWS